MYSTETICPENFHEKTLQNNFLRVFSEKNFYYFLLICYYEKNNEKRWESVHFGKCFPFRKREVIFQKFITFLKGIFLFWKIRPNKLWKIWKIVSAIKKHRKYIFLETGNKQSRRLHMKLSNNYYCTLVSFWC